MIYFYLLTHHVGKPVALLEYGHYYVYCMVCLTDLWLYFPFRACLQAYT